MQETNGNVVYLSQATLVLSANRGHAPPSQTAKQTVWLMATDENENVTPQDSSASESDSDPSSEYEDTPVQYTIPAAVKKANKYHPLNWYTPTVLSPIMDVSPSLEDREAEGNTTSSAATGQTISNSLDEDITDRDPDDMTELTDRDATERDVTDRDATESEVNSSSNNGGTGGMGKLKRSPAIIDFSDPGKMSKSTGDLPDYDEAALVEDSSTDQSVSLITRSESALQHELQSAPSSTNLLFEEISVPFYFTLPQLCQRKEYTSMDESLNRPRPQQNRLSLVMSQIMLKEELKEALYLQRSKLAECEIEADERAAKVQRKLEQFRRRKGSLGSRKVHIAPDKHVYDGRWCSEPSLINGHAYDRSDGSDRSVCFSVACQTDFLTDLSQLGRTIPNGSSNKKLQTKEAKKSKSTKGKKKTSVAVNTQITWRSLQVPPAEKDKKQALANFQGFSGITYGDLLDFSNSNTKRCAFCNHTTSQPADQLYAYFQSTNPRRVSLFNDYNHKSPKPVPNYLTPNTKYLRKDKLLGECGVKKL